MIAAEIIRAASKGMPKTKIMYSARLNYKQLTRYLDGLTREGLLHSDDKGGVFTTTERGIAFLNSYDEVENLTETLAEKERAMHALLMDRFTKQEGRAGKDGHDQKRRRWQLF